MAEPKPHDHQLPAKVTDATFEPASGPDPFWENGNVGWKGWTRLVIICVTVGAIFQAGNFNPFAPGFTIGAGLGQIVNGVINIAAWAAQNGGLPLILGALAVLPFWIGWRALVTLFNKDKPPGPDDRILPKERRKKPHKL
ncbi:MAG: hypothetical protein B7Z22_02915 [Hyphomonas sp. 32-62-5]|nr:MAG: hypothetical protein B7Z22_02915 [Hyphomonas sp. 32-62-5]